MNSPLLLSGQNRTSAIAEAGKLAMISCRFADESEGFPSQISRLSQLCADACLPPEASGAAGALSSASFQLVPCIPDLSTSGVLVLSSGLGCEEERKRVAFVADAMGAGGFEELTADQHNNFVETLHEAAREISRLPLLAEIVNLNSGSIYPYLCRPPSIGSGSALQMPGAMLLPAGVPSVILAECWIHEALHTELHLAEWLEGSPQAEAEHELETPWRNVSRPASLLLHGAFVFSCLILFIRSSAERYSRIPRHWELSATRGTQIALCDVESVIAFRTWQVRDAVVRLKSSARLSPIGRQALEIIDQNMNAL